jgi:ABC-type multidrug transport system permease subunit
LVSLETPKSRQGRAEDATTETTAIDGGGAKVGGVDTDEKIPPTGSPLSSSDENTTHDTPPPPPATMTTAALTTSKENDAHHLALPASLGTYARQRLAFRRAFPILLQRGIINLRRQPNLLTGRITQLVGLGIVLTAFLTPLGTDYYSVQTRVGYIQAQSSMFFVGMLNSIAMYPSERDIFYHEDRDGTYPLEAFFLYYLTVEVPMEVVASMLFSCLTVFAVGLPRTAGEYFLMAYSAFCVVSCGESFGILFLTIFSHTGLAVSVMSVVLSVAIHLGGVLSIGIDGFLQAVNHVSPIKWQVGALLSYSLRDVRFTCTPDQRLANGACPVQTGVQVLELYRLDVDTVAYALALGGVTIGYRLLAYLGLKARRTDWKRGLTVARWRTK